MHDVLIIGAGPAGLSAACWCDELGLDTLVLEQNSEVGGQLLSVYNPIENYLGVSAANGRELRDRFLDQTRNAEFDLWTNVEIASIDLRSHRVQLRSGEELKAISIIIATGTRRRSLGIPGESEFAGRGMIESATRDRDFFVANDSLHAGFPKHCDAMVRAQSFGEFTTRPKLPAAMDHCNGRAYFGQQQSV
ncbi:MAG TPA: FAD-dependent oxidoreductase, partial [Pyrinomonadaceae bacterium]